MQLSLNDDVLENVTYLLGDAEVIKNMQNVSSRIPFCDEILDFLNDVSKSLMKNQIAKNYPDIITFAFWIRKSSTLKLKERFFTEDGNMYLGRGVAFHIAPSNVPVNYAYSLVVGLLTGNANIVRVPTKDFPQVQIINEALKELLKIHETIKPYICLIRYGREKSVNDALSSIANTRIIWGGDHTIEELRKSPLPPRAGEITFADRYSLCVIDSETYLQLENKKSIAEGFYNDTYLTDQNACTSPRLVVWMGRDKEKAKEIFWESLHDLAEQKYVLQPIQSINKLTSSYLHAAVQQGVKIEARSDNLIVRVKVPQILDNLMELKDNSGYFPEYDCDNITDLFGLCNDLRCQTIGYIGDVEMLMPLLKKGVKGIDRIVPVGNTMDFDFIWDGYNLYERLTRVIQINIR